MTINFGFSIFQNLKTASSIFLGKKKSESEFFGFTYFKNFKDLTIPMKKIVKN
jgi:hypothetical protein